MTRAILIIVVLALGGCAYTMPQCHSAGEDYTAADACR
jgi:hypothetical protein